MRVHCIDVAVPANMQWPVTRSNVVCVLDPCDRVAPCPQTVHTSHPSQLDASHACAPQPQLHAFSEVFNGRADQISPELYQFAN